MRALSVISAEPETRTLRRFAPRLRCGGPFRADTAAVLDEFTAVGRNIYNQGDTTRDVYSVQADVIPGNSGGPLVDLSGNVIGVVFATSTEYNSVGYALSIHQVIDEINQAKASNQAVSTGSCAE